MRMVVDPTSSFNDIGRRFPRAVRTAVFREAQSIKICQIGIDVINNAVCAIIRIQLAIVHAGALGSAKRFSKIVSN